MKINLITISSSLAAHRKIRTIHNKMINTLEENFEVNYYNENEISTIDIHSYFTLIWIASGGTERKFIELYPQIQHPIFLINDGIGNSLAASLEISAWLKRQKCQHYIIHDSTEKIAEKVIHYAHLFNASKQLKKQRIGVIGEPSDWLIASDVNNQIAYQKFGIEFVSIPLDEIYPLYEAIAAEEVEVEVNVFINKAIKLVEGNREEINKAMRLYKAIHLLCKKHHLNALTLRCFGLIDKTQTTGCLALALLNKKGIIAGCEGDMQSILSLLIAKAVTGKTGFMANPSIIDTEENKIVFSHCMIDTSLPQDYIIRSHYETLSGIAIQGVLPLGQVTIFKMGGLNLDEKFISKAQLIENTNYSNFCRTQARFQLEESVNYFLTHPIGNHHIILWGDYTHLLKDFFEIYV
jgi:L-fucose isomerase-like protein